MVMEPVDMTLIGPFEMCEINWPSIILLVRYYCAFELNLGFLDECVPP